MSRNPHVKYKRRPRIAESTKTIKKKLRWHCFGRHIKDALLEDDAHARAPLGYGFTLNRFRNELGPPAHPRCEIYGPEIARLDGI